MRAASYLMLGLHIDGTRALAYAYATPPLYTRIPRFSCTLSAATLRSQVSPPTHKEAHVTPLKRIAAITAALIMTGGACLR